MSRNSRNAGVAMLGRSALRGAWTYLYRAVDKHGLTIDFLLSERRDTAVAKRFFTRAVQRHGAPERITPDGYPATHAAVAELKASGVIRQETKIRTSKYLNNIIEQDHRRVKQRVYSMLGFKGFRNATIAIKGIELAQKIRKGQFDTSGVIARCLVPQCDGVVCLSPTAKEALWDNFYTAAPARLRHCVERYNVVKRA